MSADNGQATSPVITEDVSSMANATEAMLRVLDGEQPQSEPEAEQPTQELDSQPEEQEEDVSSEEDEFRVLEDDDEEEYEPQDNKAAEGEDVETYTIVVNGEDVNVTLDELKSGYSRQSDYTRKTQELAENRAQLSKAQELLQQQLTDTATARQQYIQAIGQFMQNSNTELQRYASIDWARLKEEDPIEYVTKRDEFREQQDRMRHAQALQQKAQQDQIQQAEVMKQQMIQNETAKLSTVLPEWRDANKRQKIAGQIREYANKQGYHAEEIDNLVDSRSVMVLLKAMKYDQMMGADPRSKRIKKKTKTLKSGSEKGKGGEAKKERAAKMEHLKQTGDMRSAASLLEDLF